MRIKIGKLYRRINTQYRFRTLAISNNYVFLHGLDNDVRFYITTQQFKERYQYIR